jgi:branched-chain amino acid transport system ATP-binding protein
VHVTAALETRSLRKSFGGVLVIDDLSITADHGEALGIVGPNGAGKTTWFNLVTGAVHADAGKVIFEGRDITHLSRHERCRQGIGRTFQIPKPFSGMTVFENVLVGATHGRRMSERASYDRCVEVLEITGLLKKANVLAGTLTLLDRKRLELARALATDPTLLLMDEIAGGLTEAEVEELIEEIQKLRQSGITIVWIEHIVHALLAVVDRIVVIQFGRELCQGEPHEVMNSQEVQACYMGGTPA